MSKPSGRVFTCEFKQSAGKRIEARERLAAEDALIPPSILVRADEVIE